jgi:uncharacterized protein
MPEGRITVLVQQFYSLLAARNGADALRLLDPQVEWTEAERTPYYVGTMRGVDAVLSGVFAPLDRDFDDFACTPKEFISQGERVVAFGIYTGIAKRTGRAMSAPFVHLWTGSNRCLCSFSQYTDSAVWNEALGRLPCS